MTFQHYLNSALRCGGMDQEKIQLAVENTLWQPPKKGTTQEQKTNSLVVKWLAESSHDLEILGLIPAFSEDPADLKFFGAQTYSGKME